MPQDVPPPNRSAAPSNRYLVFGGVGLVALVTVAGFASLFAAWASSKNITAQQTLRLASSQFVAGNVAVAGDLAATVELDETDEEYLAWLALREFLRGAGLHAKASLAASPRLRRDKLAESIPILRRAEEIGFPDGRAAEGRRLLGVALYETEQYDAAIEQLKAAIDDDVTLQDELRPMLARSMANSPLAKPVDALETIERHLDNDTLDDQKWAEASLLRLQLLVRIGRIDQIGLLAERMRRRTQSAVDAEAPWAIELRDRMVLLTTQRNLNVVIATLPVAPGQAISGVVPVGLTDKVAPKDRELLAETLSQLSQLQREGSPQVGALARLAAANVNLLLGENDDALSLLTQVRQQRPFSDESLEAGLAEVELLAHQGRGEELYQTTRYLVREILQSTQLNFSQQRRGQFAGRMVAALGRLRGQGGYESAAETASALSSVLASDAASIQRGIAFRDWGEATLKEGTRGGGDISRESSATARQHFRMAGDSFADAARTRFATVEYLPTLWDAIDAYQRGRHFERSAKLLKDYLRYEERGRKPRGLIAHGRALMAEGNPEAAIESLQLCILEYPRDPLRYDARLLAAQAAMEKGDLNQAEQWLEENLNDGQLTPQSPAWRDSLFTLGELLYSRSETLTNQLPSNGPATREAVVQLDQTLLAAKRRLTEASTRYPGTTPAHHAAYLLARLHLLSTRLPMNELQAAELTDAARRDLRQKLAVQQQAAISQFDLLIEQLDDRKRDADLSERQTALLRNALLLQADTFQSMDRINEAADAYRDLAMRTMNEPPCLEALLGQSLMMRRLGRDREADLLIRQSSAVLDRISPEWDSKFEEVTRYDRAGWKTYLDWLSKKVNQSEPIAANNNFRPIE